MNAAPDLLVLHDFALDAIRDVGDGAGAGSISSVATVEFKHLNSSRARLLVK